MYSKTHQLLLLCGINESFQLREKSNNKDIIGEPIISPPLDPDFDFTNISSYSVFSNHAVVITYDGEMFAIGNNEDGRISSALPKQKLKQLTKFEIKDSTGQIWNPISAVCGSYYTLFLVSNPKKSNDNQLVYSLEHSKSKFPHFIELMESNPISIYGFDEFCAAIFENGSVIIIPPAILNHPDATVKSIHLPHGQKATKVACCGSFCIILSSTGDVFKATISKKMEITQILQGKKMIDISGSFKHCFAVAEDGSVYGFGKNDFGQLGTKKKANDEFRKISSLDKYKITAAYAGLSHSLFQTSEGKILGCGGNTSGEIPGVEVTRDGYFSPVETTIKEGASFCIAGSNLSAIFFGKITPNTPNRKVAAKEDDSTGDDDDSADSVIHKEGDEIQRLKNEISRLNKEIDSLRSKITPPDSIQGRKQRNIEIIDQETINSMKHVCQIGRGGQSNVFKVFRPQNYALKVLCLSNKPENGSEDFKNMKLLLQECEILYLLNHPNIVKSYGFCYGDEENPPSILMQFCPNNLKEVIKDLDDMHRVCAIFEISSAMEAVHAANLIHRDLKPENILIDIEGHVRVSDFGVSCFESVENQTKTSGVGSLHFMAPEILNENDHYGNKVDVYSFGVVVFFILTHGELPKISVAAQSNGKKAQIPEKINSVSRNLINKCWEADAEDRPSFSEIVEIIKNNEFDLIDGVKSNLTEIKSFLSL